MKNSSIVWASCLLLAGCGGGGGGDDDAGAPADTVYNVAAANHNFLNVPQSWATTGTASNVEFTFGVATLAMIDGVFKLTGQSSARVTQTVSFGATGVTPESSSVIAYFNKTSDALIGAYDSQDDSCTRVDSNGALPTTARIGNSGPLSTSSTLNGCTSGSAVTATDVTTWWLETDQGVVLVCQNSVVSTVGSSSPDTLNLCIETAPDGTLGKRARFSITSPSVSLALVTRNY